MKIYLIVIVLTLFRITHLISLSIKINWLILRSVHCLTKIKMKFHDILSVTMYLFDGCQIKKVYWRTNFCFICALRIWIKIDSMTFITMNSEIP